MTRASFATFPARIQFASGLRILATSRDRFYWISESQQGVWRAPCAGTLAAAFLSNSATAAALRQFPEKQAKADALRTIQQMISAGFLVPLGVSGAAHLKQKRRSEGKVTAVIFDEELGSAIGEALAAHELKLVETSRFWVVTVKDYLDPRLQTVHEQCRRQGVAWMLTKPVGQAIWIGPVFGAEATACWRCLAMRLTERRWVEAQLFEGQQWPGPSYTSTSRSALALAAHLAARDAAAWLSGDQSLANAIRSVDHESLASALHCVARFPTCADCGKTRGASQLKLQKRTVIWNPTEELRLVPPAATLDRLRSIESPITGIVRDAKAWQSGRTYNFSSEHNVTIPPKELRLERAMLMPGYCSGRGRTETEARAGCLAEAVERYALQFRGDEPRLGASYKKLGAAAIHPAQILLFSDAQYEHRHAWNQVHDLNDAVPDPFDEMEEVEWVAGWSLTGKKVRYLPAAVHSMYYRPPAKCWIADADSNGCASGNEMEEAILEGLLELVERDAVSIWWYNRIRRPAYTLGVVADARSQLAHEELRDNGWTVRLLDLTTDLSIPAFAALGIRRTGEWSLGSSAHHYRMLAMRRALSELCQLSSAQVRNGPLPAFVRAREALNIEMRRRPVRVELRSLIERGCRKLARAGIETVVFDLTRREIGFPVARVVAPGLRHLKPRFAPGRLFETPVRMGWLPRPGNEQDFPTHRP